MFIGTGSFLSDFSHDNLLQCSWKVLRQYPHSWYCKYYVTAFPYWRTFRSYNTFAKALNALSDTKPTGNGDMDALSVTTRVSCKDSLRLRILPRLGHYKITAITAKTLNDYSKEMRKDGVRLDKKPSGLSEGTLSRDKLLYHRTDASVPVGIRQAPIISSKE